MTTFQNEGFIHIDDLDQHALDAHRPSMDERNRVDYRAVAKDVGRIGEGKNYLIRTHGCQMNEHDTEIMSGMLEEMGYRPTTVLEDADFVLYNTCAVRENAEDKVFGHIGTLKPMKAKNPNLMIGLCGCMAQEEVVRAKIQEKHPHVDLVFGTHNLHMLPELIEQAQHTKETIFEVWDKSDATIENLPKIRKDKIRAWVNIQYGCNKFCTYCIVPFTRGAERSRQPEDILAELRDLAAEGYKEVTLLGQNVNDYGIDLGNVDFGDLLEMAAQVEGLERIRFTTSNPWNFTDKMIDVIAKYDNIPNHIQLPAQSGSSQTLRRMKRGYTREDYLDLVNRIKTKIPNVSMTTDIIVGFPGETEEQFQETLSLMETVRYDGAFMFIYSPREGTPATRLPDDVTDAEKKDRLKRLNELQDRISLEINKSLEGKVLRVLVEGESKNNPDVLQTRTESNKIVHITAPKELIGHFVNVKVTEAKTWTLNGELVSEEVPAV
ncbi:tRNA (N6-isopentenyl adenosine(37)-C2)-methylthiotransferase MiaB [Tumebacillus sp. ITR2]|uniref:tRNA-2-methylthio-N(6)-dimethylallyladenosine synthase n=1 Tax=Tumebacillus amylolyticus TaxID=2801339 RepID=A0ABS1JCN0_9BACL|nr:tRNA (N6-isopentenyl adenosine(37)-C2)-methylthiotransferase MiaB [Tumebacillus amylolyticus]MBL0387980.1 tRNA (N6-isopentenyl adenosine(37)-C2)-methylthiotransferase MiaB [Tumebacillus amylolyticus]